MILGAPASAAALPFESGAPLAPGLGGFLGDVDATSRSLGDATLTFGAAAAVRVQGLLRSSGPGSAVTVMPGAPPAASGLHRADRVFRETPGDFSGATIADPRSAPAADVFEPR